MPSNECHSAAGSPWDGQLFLQFEIEQLPCRHRVDGFKQQSCSKAEVVQVATLFYGAVRVEKLAGLKSRCVKIS